MSAEDWATRMFDGDRHLRDIAAFAQLREEYVTNGRELRWGP